MRRNSDPQTTLWSKIKDFFSTPKQLGVEQFTVEQIAEMMKPDPSYVPDPSMIDFAERMEKLLGGNNAKAN